MARKEQDEFRKKYFHGGPADGCGVGVCPVVSAVFDELFKLDTEIIVEKYIRGEVKRTELEQMVANTNLKQFVPVRSRKK